MSDASTLQFREAMKSERFEEAAEIAQRQLSHLENTSGQSTYEYFLALEDIATVDHALRDYPAAAKNLEQAVATLNRLTPSCADHRRNLARCLSRLGTLYLDLNKVHDAEAMLSQALTLARSIPTSPDLDTGTESFVLLRMADVCAKKKDWPGALQRILESLQHSRPHRSGHRGLYCDGLARLSRVYMRLGRLADAEKVIRRAMSWHLDYSVRESLDYAWLTSILGMILLKRGDLQGAAPLREEALTIVRNVRPADDFFVTKVESYFVIENEVPSAEGQTKDGESKRDATDVTR